MTEKTPDTLERLWDDISTGNAPIAEMLSAGHATKRRKRRMVIAGAAAATALVISGGVVLRHGTADNDGLVADPATDLTVRITYSPSPEATALNVTTGHAAWNEAETTLIYVSAARWSGSCPPEGTATAGRDGVTLELAQPDVGDQPCTADARSITATITGLTAPPTDMEVTDGGTARTVPVDNAGTQGGATPIDLPTSDWRPGDPSMHALIHGTLAVDEHNCAYLASSGSESRYALWPAGYTATITDAGQLTLYNATGDAIAQSGDDLTMGGGFVPLPESAEPRPCLPAEGSDIAYIQSEVPLPAPPTATRGELTDAEYIAAVSLAQQRLKGEEATITSATVTVGDGTVTNSNVGYECESGRLLHIKLIGTFPHIVTTGHATQPGSTSPPEDFTVHAIAITADAESGRACLVGVQTGDVTATPGSVALVLN